jgi:hypothetical protein
MVLSVERQAEEVEEPALFAHQIADLAVKHPSVAAWFAVPVRATVGT